MMQMSKAVLVIDMPKNCANCPLKSQLRTGLSNVTHCCNLTESMIKLDEMFEKRLDGCPLKVLPKEDDSSVNPTLENIYYAEGWNDCLKEIVRKDE